MYGFSFLEYPLTSQLAKEFVSWAVGLEEISTRAEAVELAEYLFDNGIIRHSAGKNEFVDGHYFYYFTGVRVVRVCNTIH